MSELIAIALFVVALFCIYMIWQIGQDVKRRTVENDEWYRRNAPDYLMEDHR